MYDGLAMNDGSSSLAAYVRWIVRAIRVGGWIAAALAMLGFAGAIARTFDLASHFRVAYALAMVPALATYARDFRRRRWQSAALSFAFALDAAAIEKLLQRAEAIEGKKLPLDDDARASLIRMADGDGRAALTLAEEVWRATRAGETFDAAALQDIVQRRAPIYDKAQDGHYNLISALHKSVRGSDVDAALYYLCRMLDAGEDPLYLARRVVRMAVEDIGLADPQALIVANAAKDAYDFLGSPEGELAIAEAVLYMATAPKSNASYAAFGVAMRTAKQAGSLLPPKHILNAPP